MIVFRLCKTAYSADLTGIGAEKTGGRWNSKGVAMVYTSASRALCITEIAVHTPLGNLPVDYALVSIEIPDEILIKILPLNELPFDWRAFPHSHSTQEIGDRFIMKLQYAVFKVPSAVVQGEYNYLLNPGHPDISLIKIIRTESFDFDERLFLR
jgi:RES domain-containing protein